MKTNKQGISLIVLVITIIVMIILAGAIILSLSNTGIFDRAEEATFKETVRAYETELTLYMAERISNNPTLDMTTINASKTTTPSIKDMIPSITASDEDVFEVSAGALKYVGEDTNKITWCESIGVNTLTEEDKYNEKYAKAIAKALTIGKVENGEYTITKELDETGSNLGFPDVTGTIAIPYGVTKVNNIQGANGGGFYFISSIVLPDTVTQMGSFSSCYELKNLTLSENITVIPSGWLAHNYYLETVTLPAGINKIESGAFGDMLSEFKTINYRGTQAQWNAIEGVSNVPSTVTIVYNYNG